MAGLALLMASDLLGSDDAHHEPASKAKPAKKAFNTNDLVAVAPPPFSEDIFPCSECHDPTDEVNTTPHPVDEHEDIIFEHDAENRWCLDCHDEKNRDKLHLANGKLIDFTESHKLCGQCHGPKYRDWKAGDHGKRTGMWNGKKEYLLCVHCHDPHSPSIKGLTPKPPPIRPENLR
jgi:hypothetical protein